MLPRPNQTHVFTLAIPEAFNYKTSVSGGVEGTWLLYQGMTGIHHHKLGMSLKVEDSTQRTHPQITQTSTTLDCSLIFINVLIWNLLELSIHLIIVPGYYTFSFSSRMPCYLHLLEATLLPQFLLRLILLKRLKRKWLWDWRKRDIYWPCQRPTRKQMSEISQQWCFVHISNIPLSYDF